MHRQNPLRSERHSFYIFCFHLHTLKCVAGRAGDQNTVRFCGARGGGGKRAATESNVAVAARLFVGVGVFCAFLVTLLESENACRRELLTALVDLCDESGSLPCAKPVPTQRRRATAKCLPHAAPVFLCALLTPLFAAQAPFVLRHEFHQLLQEKSEQ